MGPLSQTQFGLTSQSANAPQHQRGERQRAAKKKAVPATAGYMLPVKRKKPRKSNLERRGASAMAASAMAQAVRGLTRAQRHLAEEVEHRGSALSSFTRGAVHIPALLQSSISQQHQANTPAATSTARSAMSDNREAANSPSSAVMSAAVSTGRLSSSLHSPVRLSTRMSVQSPVEHRLLKGETDATKGISTPKSTRRSSLRTVAELEQVEKAPPSKIATGPMVWLQTQMAARETEIEEVRQDMAARLAVSDTALARLEARMEQQVEATQRARESSAKLDKQVTHLCRQLAEVQQSSKELERDSTSRLAELYSRLDQLDKRMDRLEEKQTDAQVRGVSRADATPGLSASVGASKCRLSPASRKVVPASSTDEIHLHLIESPPVYEQPTAEGPRGVARSASASSGGSRTSTTAGNEQEAAGVAVGMHQLTSDHIAVIQTAAASAAASAVLQACERTGKPQYLVHRNACSCGPWAGE